LFLPVLFVMGASALWIIGGYVIRNAHGWFSWSGEGSDNRRPKAGGRMSHPANGWNAWSEEVEVAFAVASVCAIIWRIWSVHQGR
jgi:hypothetical protein